MKCRANTPSNLDYDPTEIYDYAIIERNMLVTDFFQ